MAENAAGPLERMRAKMQDLAEQARKAARELHNVANSGFGAQKAGTPPTINRPGVAGAAGTGSPATGGYAPGYGAHTQSTPGYAKTASLLLGMDALNFTLFGQKGQNIGNQAAASNQTAVSQVQHIQSAMSQAPSLGAVRLSKFKHTILDLEDPAFDLENIYGEFVKFLKVKHVIPASGKPAWTAAKATILKRYQAAGPKSKSLLLEMNMQDFLGHRVLFTTSKQYEDAGANILAAFQSCNLADPIVASLTPPGTFRKQYFKAGKAPSIQEMPMIQGVKVYSLAQVAPLWQYRLGLWWGRGGGWKRPITGINTLLPPRTLAYGATALGIGGFAATIAGQWLEYADQLASINYMHDTGAKIRAGREADQQAFQSFYGDIGTAGGVTALYGAKIATAFGASAAFAGIMNPVGIGIAMGYGLYRGIKFLCYDWGNKQITNQAELAEIFQKYHLGDMKLNSEKRAEMWLFHAKSFFPENQMTEFKAAFSAASEEAAEGYRLLELGDGGRHTSPHFSGKNAADLLADAASKMPGLVQNWKNPQGVYEMFESGRIAKRQYARAINSRPPLRYGD